MNITKPAGVRPLWAFALYLFSYTAVSAAVRTDQIFVVRNHATVFEAPLAGLETVRILEVVETPHYGELRINADQTLTFSPQRDVCEMQDGFSYRIERAGREELVRVTVDILCEALTVVSNFSPNGDGQNDTFTILGIQNYPDSKLTIFDGAGLEVFSAVGYANDWRGTDPDGQALEANGAVYYYVLQDGAARSYSGILTIE